MANVKFYKSPNQNYELWAKKYRSAGQKFEGSSTPYMSLKMCLYQFILEKVF